MVGWQCSGKLQGHLFVQSLLVYVEILKKKNRNSSYGYNKEASVHVENWIRFASAKSNFPSEKTNVIRNTDQDLVDSNIRKGFEETNFKIEKRILFRRFSELPKLGEMKGLCSSFREGCM